MSYLRSIGQLRPSVRKAQIPSQMRLKWLIVTLACALAWLESDAPAQRFRFDWFTSAEGLASAIVFSIDEDSRGYVWVATAKALSRFDGQEFVSFDHSTGLRDQRLTAIARDPRGRIWLGTEQGISVWDGQVVRNYGVNEGLGSGSVWTIAFDKRGRAWLGTQAGGINSFDAVVFEVSP